MAQRMPRKIPERLGSQDLLFEDFPVIGMVEMNDGVVALGPSLFVLFASQNILPSSLGSLSLIFSILTALLGLSLLVIKPPYLTLSEWVGNMWSFRKRTKNKSLRFSTEDGEPIDGVDVTTDDDTRDIIDVKKIHPEQDIIERTDGTMVSIISIEGANMDTADQETWITSVEELSSRLNTQLREPVQLFLPMRQFDPTDQVQMYEERKSDRDIRNGSQFMQQYVQDRINWMNRVGDTAYIREYYAVVAVSRKSILENAINTGGSNNLDKLEQFPGGEVLKDVVIGIRGNTGQMMSKRDIQERQFKELDRLRQDVQRIFDVGPGNETGIVDADEIGVILKEFWEGTSLRADEGENLIRERRYVTGRADREKTNTQETSTSGGVPLRDDL